MFVKKIVCSFFELSLVIGEDICDEGSKEMHACAHTLWQRIFIYLLMWLFFWLPSKMLMFYNIQTTNLTFVDYK